MAEKGFVPIPEPRGLPFLGNILEIDFTFALGSFIRLAETHGPIYRFRIPGGSRVIVSSQALANEVCDERRFAKKVTAALEQVRNGTHDGLFTAYGSQERNWGIAHRILMPAFGPISILNMFDEMYDIASQLAAKWARHGPNHSIQVTDDFTRLTLDTLALCTMDYRFNSFYSSEMHPFVEAMGSFLVECGNRVQRPAVVQSFLWNTQAKYEADISVMAKTGQEVIDTRRANPTEKKDFLNAMLKGKDPKTGEGLSDSNIIDNMVTFLIAGHETTSGLLSFLFYYLLKDPNSYQRAQKEVDQVIGENRISAEHLSKLPFLNALLRETLRLQSSAPMFTVSAENSREILQGKYRVEAGEPIAVLLHQLHRDPAVWGEDADEFRPERMLDENFNRTTTEFPNCWKPFGNGMRACIGRPFAWQEALLVTAMLLQNFNFSFEDPSYRLSIKQTLTIKPKDFRMRAFLRHNLNPIMLERKLASGTFHDQSKATLATRMKAANDAGNSKTGNGIPLSIYFGSNTGTCEALAHRLANDATSHGFKAVTIDYLDSVREKLPKDHAIAIVLASYEGQPADNAAHFVTWLQSLKSTELRQVKYSVFGCGHRDWAQTLHRIPKLVDRLLEEHGAQRLAPLGVTDQVSSDMFTDFESWEDEVFWTAMKKEFDSAEKIERQEELEIQLSAPRPGFLKQDVRPGRVTESTLLSERPEKRHIEVDLPQGMEYSCGDYLVVLPLNPKENTARAMRYFNLAPDSMVAIGFAGPTNLPKETPISATDLFGAYLELGQPASKRAVGTLASLARGGDAPKDDLTRLASDSFDTEIAAKRVTLLDLLERFPSVAMPLTKFLQLQPPLRARQYSISSSPLRSATRATLTYAVLDEPSLASPWRRHLGTASSYLASLAPGDMLSVSVRPGAPAFRPPNDPTSTPIIMAAAGTGLAPFRGFVQERATQMAAGRKLAPALLFFGCRQPGRDDLYAELFEEWEAAGAVRVLRAYSRAPASSNGCRYVQDRMWRERHEVVQLWDGGARLYVCGRGVVGRDVGKTFAQIFLDAGRHASMLDAEQWFAGLRNNRVAVDVFA